MISEMKGLLSRIIIKVYERERNTFWGCPDNNFERRTKCFWMTEVDSLIFKGTFFFFFDKNLGNRRKYKVRMK